MTSLDLDHLETQHRRWLESEHTSAGQREDSTTILQLTAELRKARDALAAEDNNNGGKNV